MVPRFSFFCYLQKAMFKLKSAYLRVNTCRKGNSSLPVEEEKAEKVVFLFDLWVKDTD